MFLIHQSSYTLISFTKKVNNLIEKEAVHEEGNVGVSPTWGRPGAFAQQEASRRSPSLTIRSVKRNECGQGLGVSPRSSMIGKSVGAVSAESRVAMSTQMTGVCGL